MISLKNNQHLKKILFILLFCQTVWSQHHSKMTINVDEEKKTLTVFQELTYFNQSNDTLTYIVLNDWMNAYSDKNTDLGKRFSDEFERGFHLAKDKERGKTQNITILDSNNSFAVWERDTKFNDVIHVRLKEKLLPNEKTSLKLTYTVKLPSDEFTKYGYGNQGKLTLKNWYLTPARYEDHRFIEYNNLNLDDISNALSDFDIEIIAPSDYYLSTDLDEQNKTTNNKETKHLLSGKNRLEFILYLSKKNDFFSFKNDDIEVVTNLADSRVSDISKSILIDKITNYVKENLGTYPFKKITVSQTDYERNPFYGLNQLPAFISPFPDEFLFEIKFLKTYLNNYLHNTIRLNPRNDNWIYDGIQVYLMMKYIDENYPESKMMGNVSKLKILRGYNLVSLGFNGQYSYFYMLMARKNLDQQLDLPKDKLIKFNEKIASKYRSGLSFIYLEDYLEEGIVHDGIKNFYKLNTSSQTEPKDFRNILTVKSNKKIDWFFDKIISSRDIIDYKFDKVTKTKDSISFSIKNRTNTNVPIPIYGIKDKKVVFKKWLEVLPKDSVITIPRNDADRIVINYENKVPEYNQRNNWRSLHGFRLNNRPIKFNFMKDLEDPVYNQILYVPTLEYNLYDGFLPGMRLHNKTILDKPFIFDFNPTFSTKTKNFSGKGFLYVNHYIRSGNLYEMKYLLNGHYLHYAPDAYYTKINPSIIMRFRPDDFRNNEKSMLMLKYISVNKEKSNFTTAENTENYGIFNAKFINSKTEVTHHFNFMGDMQFSNSFGKIASEFQFRKLFDNNRQLNIRVFTGTFIYNNNTSNYFDFGLDRPSDYLFESDYLGRSETTGLFSQQSIVTDGFFKSKLETRFANQWMATTNISTNIWNWIEVYGDIGAIKNKKSAAQFVYDSGIRLNLVTDYFELYFPVYSNLGWEIGEKNYGERIRFIATFRPETLLNLFTRKWF